MLIGICGKKGAGKSTAAKMLVDDYNFREETFAGPLKELILNVFQVPRAALYGSQDDKNIVIPEWDISGRQLMQIMGTEIFRETVPRFIPEAEGIWVKNMARRLERGGNIVVSDVRFEDEAELIRVCGGIMVQIERTDAVDSGDTHASEVIDFHVDHKIVNNGSVRDLENALLDLLGVNNA